MATVKVRIANLFKAVLIAAGVTDAAQRLWSVGMQFDFRTFAELVGAVLLIGTIYIVRNERTKAEQDRQRRLIAAHNQTVAFIKDKILSYMDLDTSKARHSTEQVLATRATFEKELDKLIQDNPR